MDKNFYNDIKTILTDARNKVYQTANFAMVEAYWNIGKTIMNEQGGSEKAEYGSGLLKELLKQMMQDFKKGFTVANLKNMRQFYLMHLQKFLLDLGRGFSFVAWKKHFFASKHKLYLPSEEELRKELSQKYRALEEGKTENDTE